jgi:hypothetical protein
VWVLILALLLTLLAKGRCGGDRKRDSFWKEYERALPE